MITIPTFPPHEVVEQTVETALELIQPNFHMGIDVSLAVIPFLLALLLFRGGALPSLLWWPLLLIFVLFVPNAPYVLTDVIHFVAKVRVTPPLPIWAMSILLLEYIVYFLLGMQCFTLSLMLWGRFLKELGHRHVIIPLELAMIASTSFAIYLGRIERFNSWDVVTEPDRLIVRALRDLSLPHPLELTIIFFMVVLLVHYLLKAMNSAILLLLGRASTHHRPPKRSV